MSILGERYFWDENAAYEFVEAQMWPHGPVCPHCGKSDNIGKLQGTTTRIGTYKCYHCRRPFTVKIGTVFEASRLPMRVWLQSIYLIAQSDCLMPQKELEQALGISGKTARVIAYRLRKAMYSRRQDERGPVPRSAREAGAGELPRPPLSTLTRGLPVMRDIFSAYTVS